MKGPIVILVLMVLVLPVFSISAMTTDNNLTDIISYDDDFLDQQQTEDCGYSRYFSDKNWIAQGFTPTLNVLTRVELQWDKIGNPANDFDIYVGIKKELDSEDLTICSVDVNQIQGLDQWIEFDFPDIIVTPGEMYYIVARVYVDPEYDSSNFYGWGFQVNNPYDKGEAWSSGDQGKTWGLIVSETFPDRDFCFKTYGLSNLPPNNPICSYNKDEDVLVIVATDPDENTLRYGIDWDNDQVVDQWTALLSSGTEQTIDCNDRKGTVGVISEDEYGAQSSWVSVKSKNNVLSRTNLYAPIYQWLIQMMKKLPFLQSFFFDR